MEYFIAKKKSFLNWVISFCSPFLVVILIIILVGLFNKNIPWWGIMFLTMLAISISLFLFLVNLSAFCSTVILDDSGIRIINPLKRKQLKWSEIKEAIIIKPGDLLGLKPKNEEKKIIWYSLLVLNLEDQEKIKKMLKEKTNLVVESIKIPAYNPFSFPYSDDFL